MLSNPKIKESSLFRIVSALLFGFIAGAIMERFPIFKWVCLATWVVVLGWIIWKQRHNFRNLWKMDEAENTSSENQL